MDLVPSDSRWLIARALDLNIRTADRFFSPQRHRENQAFNRKVRKGGAKVAKNVTFANMINFAISLRPLRLRLFLRTSPE